MLLRTYVSKGDVWGNDFIPNSKSTKYDTEKPEKLLKHFIEAGTTNGDLVVDFFLGSGTTASVALKLNRQFIGIEQLEIGFKDNIERLKSVVDGCQKQISKSVNWQGGGSFVYCELTQHNANIIDKIELANTTEQLIAIWHEIENTDFISYQIKPELINANSHEFESLSIEEQKQFLIAVLDKNQLYVNYSEIDDADYQISEADKKLNKQFYGEV